MITKSLFCFSIWKHNNSVNGLVESTYQCSGGQCTQVMWCNNITKAQITLPYQIALRLELSWVNDLRPAQVSVRKCPKTVPPWLRSGIWHYQLPTRQRPATVIDTPSLHWLTEIESRFATKCSTTRSRNAHFELLLASLSGQQSKCRRSVRRSSRRVERTLRRMDNVIAGPESVSKKSVSPWGRIRMPALIHCLAACLPATAF